MNEYLKEFRRLGDRAWLSYEVRGDLVRRYAWAIPSDEAIRTLVRLSPIVEVGAGSGYWAKLVTEAGGNIRAFDSSPTRLKKNHFCHGSWFHVERAQANVTSRFPHRTLFLCWPPYDTGMANEALRAYRGSTVVYVGESWGGCTGNDEFHGRLRDQFECTDSVEIPCWSGIYDHFTVWRRK